MKKKKQVKSCELCDKKTGKLKPIRVDTDLYLYICAKCNKAERELDSKFLQKLKRPKRQLDCFGVKLNHNRGKISISDIYTQEPNMKGLGDLGKPY